MYALYNYTVRNKHLNEKKWRKKVASNLMPLQMSTNVVSYNYTRQSDIEDVDLLDVTLFNEEDVKLSGPFDDEQVSTEVEEDG